jgi:hypothetical protein
MLALGSGTVYGIKNCAEYAVGACACKFGVKVKRLKRECI